MIKSIIDDVENTNKQIRHYDDSGNYIRLSVDETIANNLNAWQGWSCTAGVKGLYIDFDGNVWVCNTASATVSRFSYQDNKTAAIKIAKNIRQSMDKTINNDEWIELATNTYKKYLKTDASAKKIYKKEDNLPGLLGNIFDGFEIPKKPIECRWKSCGCGADVFLAKAKNENSLDNMPVSKDGYEGQYRSKNKLIPEIDEKNIVGVETDFPLPYQILWDLGRNCNYDCSYCWPSVHNRDGEHKSLETMISTADKLITEWANDNSIRWNFGGGEPTINPYFLDFIKYLKNRNQFILVTSNGSRPRKYWKDAIQYINSVNLSVHFEFADENKLINNIEEICRHFDEHDDDHWLEIKLMCTPISINRAVALRDNIKNNTTMMKIGANNRIKGAISLVPIRSLGDSGVLVDYTTEQLSILQSQ